MVQNFLTYEDGKLIKPNRINTDKLPKFFKKGMERENGQDKILIEKTDKSMIVDEYKKLLAEKQDDPTRLEKTPLQRLKAKKKSLQEEEKIDFKKNIIDVIKTVNDALKPNYGVGITGANLKANFSEEKVNDQSQDSLASSNRGITTARDEETGLTKILALPYSFNPKLDLTLSRKEYFDNALQNTSKKTVKSLLKHKNKSIDVANVNQSRLSKKGSSDQVSPRLR